MTDDILSGPDAGGRVIRGSAWRLAGNLAGLAIGIATAALLLRHLGVNRSGEYVTVMSLVSIAGTIGDLGIEATGSRELARTAEAERPELIANILGMRLVVMPAAAVLAVLFAVAAGYPGRMVLGTALAGFGVVLVSAAHSFLIGLLVELRNLGWALIDFARQFVTLVGVAALVAAGAALTPFFAVLILTGIVLIALVPLAGGRYVRPRYDRAVQRRLLSVTLPMAAALVLGEIYFRLVIVLMSLVSSARQTGYYGGSLRAMESLIYLPALIVGVALPVLANAAGQGDYERLRRTVSGLAQGAVIAGVLLVLVTVRAAEPVMALIGGHGFRPAGAVLRIQVGALLFIALSQIWSSTLLALDRQRELILTNGLALIGVAVFAGVLVPLFDAQGGAVAGVCGDALLSALVYWRLRPAAGGPVAVGGGFLLRVLVAAAVAAVPLLFTGLPNIAAAALSGAVFVGVGEAVGIVPVEVHAALGLPRLRGR